MPEAAAHLFLPGWGAPAVLYRPGLPSGWQALEPPPFCGSDGSYNSYRDWIIETVAAQPGPVVLAGHSMGGALAIAAAAELPEQVASLVLVSPAGLPLTKPMVASLGRFTLEAASRRYPWSVSAPGVRAVLRAPWAALSIARTVRALDLSPEMRRVRRARVPATVIACATDTLVTLRHCKAMASMLGGGYRELALDGGHMWMLRAWPLLARELARAAAPA